VLASSPFARRLKALDVADNHLGDAGLAALVGAHHLSGLRRLGVAQNGLTEAGAALLTGAGPELDALDVSRNTLGEAGAEALAAVLPRVRVTTIGVSDCGLGGEGLSRLVQAGGGRLASVEAARNGLGVDGARRFADTPEAAGIRHLDLAGNDLGVAGVEALGGSRHLKNVRELSLGDNRLGDGDAETLVRALDAMPLVQTLGLAANGLGPRAMKALSASPLAARLGRLDLAHNALGDPGAEALAQGRNWHVLHELDLERNEISLGAAATVLASPGMTLLYRVNLAHNAIGGLVDLHSLSRRTVGLLESSFAELSAHGADFAERFYRLLFSRHPGVKPLFARTSMKRQQQHLLSSLAMVIENLRAPDVVAPAVHDLGERHVGYGVFASHYQAVTSTMLDAIRQTLGDRWTEDVENAWHDGLEAVSAIMLSAHRQRAAAGERGIGDAPTGEVLTTSR